MNAVSSAFSKRDIAFLMRSLRGWLGSKLNLDKDGVSSGEGASVVREREASHSLTERTLSLEEMEGVVEG